MQDCACTNMLARDYPGHNLNQLVGNLLGTGLMRDAISYAMMALLLLLPCVHMCRWSPVLVPSP